MRTAPILVGAVLSLVLAPAAVRAAPASPLAPLTTFTMSSTGAAPPRLYATDHRAFVHAVERTWTSDGTTSGSSDLESDHVLGVADHHAYVRGAGSEVLRIDGDGASASVGSFDLVDYDPNEPFLVPNAAINYGDVVFFRSADHEVWRVDATGPATNLGSEGEMGPTAWPVFHDDRLTLVGPSIATFGPSPADHHVFEDGAAVARLARDGTLYLQRFGSTDYALDQLLTTGSMTQLLPPSSELRLLAAVPGGVLVRPSSGAEVCLIRPPATACETIPGLWYLNVGVQYELGATTFVAPHATSVWQSDGTVAGTRPTEVQGGAVGVDHVLGKTDDRILVAGTTLTDGLVVASLDAAGGETTVLEVGDSLLDPLPPARAGDRILFETCHVGLTLELVVWSSDGGAAIELARTALPGEACPSSEARAVWDRSGQRALVYHREGGGVIVTDGTVLGTTVLTVDGDSLRAEDVADASLTQTHAFVLRSDGVLLSTGLPALPGVPDGGASSSSGGSSGASGPPDGAGGSSGEQTGSSGNGSSGGSGADGTDEGGGCDVSAHVPRGGWLGLVALAGLWLRRRRTPGATAGATTRS